jgi:hypothetical protein
MIVLNSIHQNRDESVDILSMLVVYKRDNPL